MLTSIIIILLAILFFAYVAIPLLFPSQTDKLPDLRDPIKQDLEEERDALFRAIKELELRTDLAVSRREQLRARYEAKAAKVLRSLDDRTAELKGQAPPKQKAGTSRLPFASLGLLSIMVIMATVMTSYVLPRVGENSMITTFFEGDLQQAQAVRDLQRAANRNPSVETLSALGDAYWNLDEAEQAEETYLRMITELQPPPAIAYRRLGYLKLQTDIPAALNYLEQARAADPNDSETLFALSEIYFAQAQPDAAIEALEALMLLPSEQGNIEELNARLELFTSVAPVLNKATQDPTEENLMALANAYWDAEEQERAADIYVRVVSNFNPHSGLAYSRLGQVLFFNGQNDQAINLLTRAVEVNDTDLTSLLFLGNAYFSTEQYQSAIDTWTQYVSVAGSEEAAGRVPSLIESAQARLAEAQLVGTETLAIGQVYAANCSACHGANGQGGVGPRLIANQSAMNEANVRSIIEYGRGTMPGFGAILSEEELAELTLFVTQELSQGQ